MNQLLLKIWYGQHPLKWLLLPFSWIYCTVASVRRYILQTFCQKHFTIPVVVVGNLSAGGVGKTPLVIALVKACQAKGLRAAVVSRGYKATVHQFPHVVKSDDQPLKAGDEPLLIAQKTGCPVIIDPKRCRAVDLAVNEFNSQIIISDDGLQHYRMGRSLEIVVIDGQRGLGNGLCLPAGPLRETSKRLSETDILVVNEGNWPKAHKMILSPGLLMKLVDDKPADRAQLTPPVAAVAAIGNPDRFFQTLRASGLGFKPYVFQDHHRFVTEDLDFSESTVVMTEKDAVKCRGFAKDNWYYLPVEARLDESFWQSFWSHEQLKGLL